MKRWTNEEIDKLKGIPQNVHTKEEISELFGRSYASVKKKSKNIGVNLVVKRHHHLEWSKDELDILKSNYKLNKSMLNYLLPNRSWNSICGMCSRLGLNRGIRNEWTKDELDLLLDIYYDSSIEIICFKIPNHSWEQIKIKASKLGIKRSNVFFRKTNLSVLLEESPTTYYWMGFLMADGSFYNNRLKLCIALKDAKHLVRFADYIDAKDNIYITDKSIEVQAKDVDVVPKICDKFDIKNRKTYNPPLNIPERFFMDFLIGFIDGDGCICKSYHRKDFNIRLKVHGSWLNLLKIIESKLFPNAFRAKLTKKGFAKLEISDSKTCQTLKQHAIKNQLPILKRKWDVIDLDYIPRNNGRRNS